MLKKIFTGLILGVIVVSMVTPLVISAAVTPPALGDKCDIKVDVDARLGTTGCVVGPCTFSGTSTDDCSICCLLSTILYVTDWIFVIILIIVIVLVFMGAINIMTSAGDPEKVGSGRNQIMFAAIGFGIALLARAIPALVKYLILPAA